MTIEKFTTETGRRAEKHIDVDPNTGNTVISIYAEEDRPLKLEKKIYQVYKNVLAEEHVETFKDGGVVEKQVNSIEPKPMKMTERVVSVPVATNDVSQDEKMADMIAQAVAAGLGAMNLTPKAMPMTAAPEFRVQSVVEKRVAEAEVTGDKTNMWWIAVLVAAVIAQAGFMAWVFLS